MLQNVNPNIIATPTRSPGPKRTYDIMKLNYTWKGMSLDVHRKVKACEICSLTKADTESESDEDTGDNDLYIWNYRLRGDHHEVERSDLKFISTWRVDIFEPTNR